MQPTIVRSALVVLIVLLAFIAVYTYDLGVTANLLGHGSVSLVLGISTAAGLLAVFCAINLCWNLKGRIIKKKRKKK